MPRYFFHTVADTRIIDREGVDFPDLGSARENAVRFAGEILKDDPELVRDGRTSRVEVTSADGTLVFAFVALAMTTPAILEPVVSS